MRPTLRAGLYAGGLVATIAGLHTAIVGARSVPGQKPANTAIESELRFYGTFYAAYGVAMLRAAARADTEPAAVRALAATMFAAGLARAGGWLATGRPHPGQRALLALELGLPPLAVAALERALSERASATREAKGTSAAVSPSEGPGE